MEELNLVVERHGKHTPPPPHPVSCCTTGLWCCLRRHLLSDPSGDDKNATDPGKWHRAHEGWWKMRVPPLTSDPRRSRPGDSLSTIDLTRRTKTEGLGEESPRRRPEVGGGRLTTIRGQTRSRESRWPQLTRPRNPNDRETQAEGTSSGGDLLGLGDKARTGDLAGSSKQRCFADCWIEIHWFVTEGSKPSLGDWKPLKEWLSISSPDMSQFVKKTDGTCRNLWLCQAGDEDLKAHPLLKRPLSWRRPELTSRPGTWGSGHRGHGA